MVGKCLLSDILLRKDMTQQELANRLGVTKQQVNNYVKNRKIMSLPIAVNVSHILKCNILELYEWTEVEVRKKRR